mmetsp:Transcript_92641/g.299661  ORF Transcript_92641/g.299661 Transcript_92641/m.299661 type:complete len:101 (-) Transcript_92641:325-627(-)
MRSESGSSMQSLVLFGESTALTSCRCLVTSNVSPWVRRRLARKLCVFSHRCSFINGRYLPGPQGAFESCIPTGTESSEADCIRHLARQRTKLGQFARVKS